MPFHHVAFAAKDIAATHDFYTRVMGFRLVKTIVTPTPTNGWARHVFYDTGNGEMIAFWDMHDETIGDDFRVDHARSLGLPLWVNHVAFHAPTMEALVERREHWREHGIEVLEMDHEWCTSIYATDPNGIMVEFCHTTRAFDGKEIEDAEPLLFARAPRLDDGGRATIHPPVRTTPDGARCSVTFAPGGEAAESASTR